MVVDGNTSADIDEQMSDIPKKPAWGITSNNTITSTDSTKRSNFADIMSEQQVEKSIEQQSAVTKVSFSQDVESEEERMMRLAIEASLQDQNGTSDEVEQQTYASKRPQPIDDDNDIKMAIALSLQESEGKSEIEEDDRKPSAMLKQEVDDIGMKESTKSSTSIAAAASTNVTTDESEILAQAIHQAELDEQLAKSKAEEASLQLAMKLQEEESLDNRLKREEICRGGSGTTLPGVRTVNRDEFQSLKSSKDYGDDRLTDRRKQEEHGMGKLLSDKSYYGEEDTFDNNIGQVDDTSEYYYYASDRNRGDDVDIDEDDMDNGIRMNSSSSSQWKRLDRDTFIGPNNEVKTKHDPDLKRRANAVQLLGSHGVKTKDVNNNISDSAYNAFKRADERQRGTKKGVARQGKVAADDLSGGRTRGGMDGNVRLQITSAVNIGLINKCNGVVKEGKEALVYHAEGGRKPQANDLTPDDTYVNSDGYDVAVKVFKRVTEFKGRGSYVDGDPRYHKQKFSTNDMRNQVVLWCEKEYRNLIRAHRAGIPVPKPLLQRENILFSRFLGDSGWPSPQLKEVDIRRGSSKWIPLYCQTLVAVRRLYQCARLVHCDLSEYNILICPQWQVSDGQITSPDKRSSDDDTLQVVLIDFASAVDIKHSSASTWLKRDLSIVRAFFEKKGIKTLSNEDAEEFVTAPFDEVKSVDIDTIDEESEMEEQETDTPNSRYHLLGWSDKNNMRLLLEKLSEAANPTK